MTVALAQYDNGTVVGYALYPDQEGSGTLNLYEILQNDLNPFIELFASPTQRAGASARYFMRTFVRYFDPLLINGFEYGFPYRYKFGNYRWSTASEAMGAITYIDTIEQSEDKLHDTFVLTDLDPYTPFPEIVSIEEPTFYYKIVNFNDNARGRVLLPSTEFSYELEPSVRCDFCVQYIADIGYYASPEPEINNFYFYNF